MKVMILEDNLIRQEKFKSLFKNQELFIFDDIKEAYHACVSNEFKVILLDHDLNQKHWVDSNEENTGYQFVKMLIENTNHQVRNSLFYIHSSNPIGANKMLNLLLDNGWDGIWFPFHLWRF